MRTHIKRILKIFATIALVDLLLHVMSLSFHLMNEASTEVVFMAVSIIVIATYLVIIGLCKLWSAERQRVVKWFDNIDF